MTNEELCRRFVNGANKGKGSNMYIRGNKLYSYYTCICERTVNERGYYNFVYNATKYSVSTSRQQTYLRSALRGENVIEVNNVCIGAERLIK